MSSVPRGRGAGLVRVLSILRIMADGRPHSMRRLAIDHHVTTRTIRRDIELLEAAGFHSRHVHRDDGAAVPRTYFALRPTARTHFQLTRSAAAEASQIVERAG